MSGRNLASARHELALSGIRELFVFNGRGVSRSDLNRNIAALARTSKSATVLVRCTMDSPHMYLVEALDICHGYGLENLSIFSM